jgi:hypothetical protein
VGWSDGSAGPEKKSLYGTHTNTLVYVILIVNGNRLARVFESRLQRPGAKRQRRSVSRGTLISGDHAFRRSNVAGRMGFARRDACGPRKGPREGVTGCKRL